MLQFKNVSKVVFSLFSMVALSGLGASDSIQMTKKYVSSDSILFEDGKMLVMDGNALLRVKTLHQDANGMFIPVAGIYGKCPNGHSYGPDGGCLGNNCAYN